MDLALSNLQRLICDKTQQTKQNFGKNLTGNNHLLLPHSIAFRFTISFGIFFGDFNLLATIIKVTHCLAQGQNSGALNED